jgi:hypothetical protein
VRVPVGDVRLFFEVFGQERLLSGRTMERRPVLIGLHGGPAAGAKIRSARKPRRSAPAIEFVHPTGWFTTTFTGTATITPSLDPGLTMPDPSVLPLTGHLTEWFGGSCNRSNVVFHSTFHFSGADANGHTLTVLGLAREHHSGGAFRSSA